MTHKYVGNINAYITLVSHDSSLRDAQFTTFPSFLHISTNSALIFDRKQWIICVTDKIQSQYVVWFANFSLTHLHKFVFIQVRFPVIFFWLIFIIYVTFRYFFILFCFIIFWCAVGIHVRPTKYQHLIQMKDFVFISSTNTHLYRKGFELCVRVLVKIYKHFDNRGNVLKYLTTSTHAIPEQKYWRRGLCM